MSYQMIRIRGAEAYRLLVTRATNLDRISDWLGVDKGSLLDANPSLNTEELQEGQELVVLASYVHLQFPHSPAQQTDEATDTEDAEDVGEEEAPEVNMEPADAEPASSEIEEQAESNLVEVEGEEPAAIREELDANDTQDEVPSPTQEQETLSPKEPTAEPTREQAPGRVTWRPFPKSIL